jgi:hypothetical protein
MTTTARVKKADVMLSERAEFVAAAFAATTNSARESKHLHFLVPLRKFDCERHTRACNRTRASFPQSFAPPVGAKHEAGQTPVCCELSGSTQQSRPDPPCQSVPAAIRFS